MPKEIRTQEELRKKIPQRWEKERALRDEKEAQKKIELADGLLERLSKESPVAIAYVKNVTAKHPGIKEFIGDYLLRIRKHSRETASHVVGVNILNTRFADKALKEGLIDTQEAAALVIGGILHDSGKLQVDKEILDSGKKLQPGSQDFNTMRSHVIHSAVNAEIYLPENLESPLKENIKRLIAEHHVLPNFTGYPKAKPTQPDILQRIFHIADSFEAMTGKRLYHEPMDTDMAIGDLYRKASIFMDRDGQMQRPEYDKKLVQLLEPIMREFAQEFTNGHKVSSSQWRSAVLGNSSSSGPAVSSR